MESGENPQDSEPPQVTADHQDQTAESRSCSNPSIFESLNNRSTETSRCFLSTPEVARLIMFLYGAPENAELNANQSDDPLAVANTEDCSNGHEIFLNSALRGRSALFSSSGSSTTSSDALKSLRNTNNPTASISSLTTSYPTQESRKDGLTLTELQEAIDIGTKNGDWSTLISLLNSVFSSYESLASSFLSPVCESNSSNPKLSTEKSVPTTPFSTKAKKLKHDLLTKPADRNIEVVKKTTDGTRMTCDMYELTSHSTEESNTDRMEHDDNNIPINYDKSVSCNDSSNWPPVNLKDLRLAWNMLAALPERQNVVDTLMRAVRRLVVISVHQLLVIQPPDGLDDPEPTVEIRIIQQKLVNLFVILYECPFATDPLHFELLLLNINRAVTWLPHTVQIQLCRAWAAAIHQPLAKCENPPEPEQTNLWCLQKILLHHITLRCLTTDHVSPNEDKQICEAALVLRIVYYASLLAGKLDSPELLKRELAENQVFEAELNSHRRNDIYERRLRVPPLEDPFAKALNISPNDCRVPFIPAKDFINETLSDGSQPKKDYMYYRSEGIFNELSFMKLPFLLQTRYKSMLLCCDNRTRMFDERHDVFMHALFSDTTVPPFFKLRVARERIVEDALLTLEITCSENPGDFKKQLFVEFEGEQGVDEGGLTKEFFHLIIERIFNPDYGMFVIDEETQTYWFNPVPFEDLDREYCLIGTLLGLAIYNNVILDIRFPSVIYRKLVGKLGTFEDLIEARPTLARGLQALLAYEEDDLTEVFGCTFVINYTDAFGSVVTSSLKENGSSITVTKENRQEYVDLYANFLLNESVKRQFNAFRRGFHMVVHESPLTFLFRPDEIETLIRGYPEYDFKELELVTTYEEYTVNSPVVKNFWKLVHLMTEEQQKQLLQFCTGSDRIPLGGMSKMKFTIARQGTDTDRLPTAHTCFNILLLPEYQTFEKLQSSLLVAITHCKGFGMV